MKLPVPIVFWNESTQQYTNAISVPVDKLCNSWVVKNLGTTLVLINGDQLQPGESKRFEGDLGEVYIGRIDVSFRTQVPPPGTITNLAVVTQKFYTGGEIFDKLTNV